MSSIFLENVTSSIVNVPHNRKTKAKYTLQPGEVLEIPEDYLLSLNEEAQNRFLRVTQGNGAILRPVEQSKNHKKAK